MKKTILLLTLIAGLLPYSTAQAQYKCLEGDCVNGQGKKALEDGSGSLEGEFWQGALVFGKAVFPNGDVFEGQFQGADLVRGVKRFKNGMIHEGKFFSTILTEGKITYPDGTSHDIHMDAFKKPAPTPPIPLPRQ